MESILCTVAYPVDGNPVYAPPPRLKAIEINDSLTNKNKKSLGGLICENLNLCLSIIVYLHLWKLA